MEYGSDQATQDRGYLKVRGYLSSRFALRALPLLVV